MLIALDTNNQLIDAATIKSIEQNDYYCPSCRESVFLKKGLKKVPHFSHYKKSDCNQFSEGETQEHLNGKRFLYEFFKPDVDEIQMEAFLPEINQRPDILLTLGKKKIAIEFQCSPISIQSVNDRTKGYHSAGYEVIWILGSPIRLEKRLTQLHIAMMNQFILTSPSILQLDLKHHRLLLYYHFNKLTTIIWSTAVLTKFCSNIDLTTNQMTTNLSRLNSIKMDIRLLKRMNYHKANNSRDFFRCLYEHGDNLYSLPKIIFYTCKWEWCIITPGYEWKYSLLCWIESFQEKTVISLKQVQNWLEVQCEEESIKVSIMPNVSDNYGLLSVFHFIKTLEKEGLLKEIKPNYWVLIRRANRYNLTL